MPNSLQPYGLPSLPGSSVYAILQEGILEWVAIPFSRGSSSWPRDQILVSCISYRFFIIWAIRETIHTHTHTHTHTHMHTHTHIYIYIYIINFKVNRWRKEYGNLITSLGRADFPNQCVWKGPLFFQPCLVTFPSD